MSTLLNIDGEQQDPYTFVEEAEQLSQTPGWLLVPLALAEPLLAQGRNDAFGIVVNNHTSIEAIEPLIERASLIAVEFPAFTDGRGLSLAVRLRRAGFTGTLRARGPVIADQFREILACGFDEVEIPQTVAERQPFDQWKQAETIISLHYQTSHGAENSILQKRLAARRKARP
ncbi:DUF934 domain-containing protein [Aureimonas fodinaquatilis]|uniref:DUF934 domain-containing protein n=1 Tax=Aureimonas fodinaquatilis TaxID=2565783 RepID=A0A5B0DUI2_9HYPH|nr:DUF934 domain-containing protein [Aureimonas fodinaquatilis]KAA0969662.1 DUF934 domain-containing protein [Aureimonas fodinaquatilis]